MLDVGYVRLHGNYMENCMQTLESLHFFSENDREV